MDVDTENLNTVYHQKGINFVLRALLVGFVVESYAGSPFAHLDQVRRNAVAWYKVTSGSPKKRKHLQKCEKRKVGPSSRRMLVVLRPLFAQDSGRCSTSFCVDMFLISRCFFLGVVRYG